MCRELFLRIYRLFTSLKSNVIQTIRTVAQVHICEPTQCKDIKNIKIYMLTNYEMSQMVMHHEQVMNHLIKQTAYIHIRRSDKDFLACRFSNTKNRLNF